MESGQHGALPEGDTPGNPSTISAGGSSGRRKDSFPPFSKERKEFVNTPIGNISRSDTDPKTASLNSRKESPSNSSKANAAQRERAKRYRGGRIGGGTIGWGFLYRKGDSDDEEEYEETQERISLQIQKGIEEETPKEQPPTEQLPTEQLPTEQPRSETTGENIGESANESSQAEEICKENGCHANLSLMTATHREEHKNMHVCQEKVLRQNAYLLDRGERKGSRILALQEQIPRLQHLVNELQRECRAVYEVLDETLKGKFDAEAVKDGDVAKGPDETVQVIRVDRREKRDGGVRTTDAGNTEGTPSAVAPGLAHPPPLPSPVVKQAASVHIYEPDAYTRDDLKPLFQNSYRYCNVCLTFIKGYDDYKQHALSCNTTPWNFVTKADKVAMPSGTTQFAPRYSRNLVQGGETLEQAQKKKTSPQARKRQRVGERAYRDGEQKEPEPEEEYDEDYAEPVQSKRKRLH